VRGEEFLRLTYAKSYKYFDKGCPVQGPVNIFGWRSYNCESVGEQRVGCLIHIMTFKLSLLKLMKKNIRKDNMTRRSSNKNGTKLQSVLPTYST